MDSIKLTTKAETLAGLCGEIDKRQFDFYEYAEGILKEALKTNGNRPIKFGTTTLRDREYCIVLEADMVYLDESDGKGPVFEESRDGEDGDCWYGLYGLCNEVIVELVKNITEAVGKGKEA